MKRRLMLSCVLTMWLVSWLFSPVTGAFAQDWEDLSTDIDRDGLLNTFEEAGWYNEAGGPFVTDPQDADSDDDGLSDGEEKLFGTNPLDNADPGIYVRYQNSFLTRDYYRAANPDYISMKQGGDKVLLTEALVVRRGTTFSIGGPTTATLTLTSNGLTALSAIKQDAHESRWIVTLPAAAKTGHYTATLTMAGWATPQVLPIYAIFELPTGLSQTELDAYVYNDDPDDVRDETSVWWYTSEWAYDWTCAAHPGQPCDNEKYHYTWGNTFAFWTHQYEKDVFLTHVMPRIEGKSTPSEAITSLTSWANHESRVDYDGINNNTYAVLERYWDSNVGCYTQFGGACQDQANLLTAFLRSAGIAARPFIVDWNRTPGHGEGTSGGWYDTSALVWQYNDWRVSRSYGSPGEEPACYPFDEDNTSTNRSIYNWYPDSSGDLIVASNATWDWNAVSTVWPDIWSDFTNGWEYSWDSRRPLELQGKSPQIDTLNIPSWQGDGWRPNDFGTAVYQLPNPYPGGNMLENWPIEPKPKACTPQHVGSCPYPTVLAAGEALTVAATLASPTVAPQYSVYLPLAMNHAQPPAAQLRPIQDEYAVDLNGNGRFDALIVEAVVDVARAGDYTLGGFLALPGGTATYGGVFADKVTVSLAPGTHIIPLTFEGLSIGKAEASEPYIVDHLWISDFADFDGRLGPWDKVTDLLQAGNVIDRYPSEKFEKLSAELADVYQHRGVDQDGDGLYDALAVDVSFDVVAKRPFRVEGALYDRQGNFAGQAVWTGVQSPATLVFDLGPVVAAPYQLARVKLFEDGGAFLDSRDQASYTIAEVGPSLTDGPITLDMYPTGVVRQGTYVTPTNVFTDSAVDLDGDGRYDQLNVAVQMQVNIPGTYRVEGWLQDAAGTEFVYTLSDPTALLTGTQALTLTFDGRAINQRGDLGGPYTVVALRILSAAGYTVLDQVHETDLALAYAPEEFEPVANAIQVFGDDMEGSLTQWASWESPWNLNTKTWPLPTKLWKATAVSPISGTLTSQVLDLSDYARPMLQFNTTYTLPTPSQGYIEVSTGGPTWSKVVTYSNGIDRWATGVLDLAAFGEKPTVKLRFAADVRNNAQWHIDDVYLYAWPAVKSASFTHTPATIMPNEPITFTASYESITDTLPITYTWDFDDGSVIVTSSPTITHQFTNDEDRLVTLVVANPYDTAEYARVLSVHQPVLQTSFTYTITALEVGVPLTFTASYTPTASDPPITYTWNFGDNGSMMTNAAMISHTYAHGGTYNVQLTTANKYGAASANHIFEIDEGVGTVSFTYAPETPMEGEPIMFGVNFTPDTASQPITYTWDFGDGAAPFTTTSPNIEHTFTAVGVYLVTITADNGYGVPVTYQTTIVITGRPLSDVTFVVAQAGLTNDYTAIFTPTYAPPDATTPVTYTWNFGDGPVVVSGASSITHTFTASGNPTHTVYLTATNGYETTPITYVQSFIVPFDDDGDGLANSYEINIGTDPHNPDTDGDGRTDGEEVTGYLYMGYSPHVDYGQWITTDPTDADSDNDGVSDGNEFTNGTHPGDSDTDDDGLNDGLEPGTNGMPSALDPDSDDDGLLDGEEVLVYYTSPVLADTDEDTLSDPMEVFTTTTSPLDPDMDEDGRLDGAEWYGYVYTSTAFTTVYTAHPDFGSV
ncbi:MAG TPA: PKD domain-containing protein, partial [Anaerolineae bacterium]|nr:PKD domain-containing protein [Anaerolineae bacterium]